MHEKQAVKYIFIPLDIFRKNVHNNSINSKLDAWLAFLSMDMPSAILELIEKYPEFGELYGQIYEICRNVEDVMGLFSKELEERAPSWRKKIFSL